MFTIEHISLYVLVYSRNKNDFKDELFPYTRREESGEE
jgi:hypothetical protein